MKKMINSTTIEGLIYEHDLQLKVTGPNSKAPGTEFISGNLQIATNDDMTNIVPVHFTYVTATNARGTNTTFVALKQIIDGDLKNVMQHGKEVAAKIRVNSAIGLNEFYSDRSGTEELVSAKRNEGGFIRVLAELNADENQRNVFDVDFMITEMRNVEGDVERNIADKTILRGAIFNFRNELLPVEFSVTDPRAVAYFESLAPSASNPIFTHVMGQQISETIVRRIEKEGAWTNTVREVTSSRKDFVINWAAAEPYAWDDETTITAAELKEAMTARQTYLAGVKQRQDEYNASRNAGAFSTPTAAPAHGGFNF